ncbi:MAG TPA: TraB/GumN family protein [Candidatus Udaeobacter sp.]|jgi:uncharacterized protein YbaP (TraB family)|nr:TraB/GumN family protein [Candidatus Udaeobacter sp.]
MPRRSRIATTIAASGCLVLAVCRLAAAEVASNGKHCLWRVTNARAPFYLLGSVHALQASDYFRTPVIEEAIKQCQQIWFEIDPKDESFGEKLREAAKLPRGQLVQSKIHPKTYEYLRKITLSGMNDWHHLRPWAIAMILRNPTLGNPDYRWGVDSYIAQRARYYGKLTGGLEPVDEHIHVFSDMFDAEGEVVLLQAIIHAKEQTGQFRQDVAAWKAGDAAQLYAIHAGEMKEAPTVWWRLLDRRNARWIPRIETAIRSGRPTLIVAGALHFAGPRGVIALLQKRGYNIEQL